jgi:excinuclease ABC subunit A
MKILEAVCEAHGWDFRAPVKDLPKEALDYLLYAKRDQERVLVRYRHERGESTYKANVEGIITNLERRYRETGLRLHQGRDREVHGHQAVPTCGGKRLRPEILAVTIGDKNVWDVATMSITDALRWSMGLGPTLNDRERAIAYQVLKEIVARLGFLVDVGLDYLTMDRRA